MESRELNARIMQAFKDAEEARLRLLGALAILVEDEIISSGRARELGAMSIEEQRAYLRQVHALPATRGISGDRGAGDSGANAGRRAKLGEG